MRKIKEGRKLQSLGKNQVGDGERHRLGVAEGAGKRDLLRQRVNAGLKAARRRGLVGGRPMWCKLFADQKGKHYWGKVVTDPTSFQAALLHHVDLDEATYQEQPDAMRQYRDKFLAHLDDEKILTPPWLDGAKNAIWFYHAHVVQKEAKEGDLTGLPLKLDTGYGISEDEAESVFRARGAALRNCVKGLNAG